MKLSKKSVANTSAGYIVNLLSNDVSRFDYALAMVHYIWLLPIQVITKHIVMRIVFFFFKLIVQYRRPF